MFRLVASLLLIAISLQPRDSVLAKDWISALDEKVVKRKGSWRVTRFRYAAASHMHSSQNGAALDFTFQGTGISVRLGGQNVRAYGQPSRGKVVASVDDGPPRQLLPQKSSREVVLAYGLAPGRHRVRLTHVATAGMAGCRIEGFRVWSKPCGEIKFTVHGERNAFLVDCRATVKRNGKLVRSSIVRNWLTGQCSLSALETGDYSLEIEAIGWRSVQRKRITVRTGQVTVVPPVYLRRDPSTVISRFRYPALNRPAIRRPGESFRARFLGYRATIGEVRITRRLGPATISRRLPFAEDKSAAHYYDRQIVVRLPKDVPAGVYDLSVKVISGRRGGFCRSSRSVHIVGDYPTKDPVLVTFGHLDTSGQYQAEYLRRIVEMSNLIAPDMVLNSNAVNPAYISGAMSHLDVPYLVNFGNHQFYGHESWYGDPVNIVDVGPNLSILNFGHPWHVNKDKARSLLRARSKVQTKVINAFESNAPLDLLNRHRVSMIHDGHGIGKKVMDIGATPTRRIGKSNSISFRVVRFKNGRVASCTYNGHDTAPYPFRREERSPLRVSFEPPNDGTHGIVEATVTNRFLEPIPRGRLTFIMPKGTYKTSHGTIESQVTSDDTKYTIVSLRVDIPKKQIFRLRVTTVGRNKR